MECLISEIDSRPNRGLSFWLLYHIFLFISMFAEIDGVKNHQSKCKKRDFLSNLAECQEVWYNKFI